MLSAPAANAADNIAICHAGGSETNPYQNNSVDPSSTDLSGHKVHVTSPQTWTKGTWWHGTWYPAGSAKPDLIPGYNFDGPLPEGYCDAVGTGPIEVTPDVTFVDPDCGVAASWTVIDSMMAGSTGTLVGSPVVGSLPMASMVSVPPVTLPSTL